MEKCAFIYNPNSGNHIIKHYLHQIERILAAKYDLKVYPTEHSGHAIEIVKELKDTDLIISAGGDGTFREVVVGNMMRDDQITLSHLPCGTANDLKHTLSLKGNFPKMLSQILDGEEIALDIFTLNDNIFFYSAALGYFANVPYETSPKIKRFLGRLAYLLRVVKEAFQKVPVYDIKYIVNNKEYEEKVSIILASNTTSIGGFNNVLKDAVLCDGKFEFRLLKYIDKKEIKKYLKGKRQTMRDIFNMVSGIKKLDDVPNLLSYQTDEVNIEFKSLPSKEWCLDGEKGTIAKKVNIKTIGTVNMLLPGGSVKKIRKKVDL